MTKYKISQDFQNTKIFIFQSLDSGSYDYTHCGTESAAVAQVMTEFKLADEDLQERLDLTDEEFERFTKEEIAAIEEEERENDASASILIWTREEVLENALDCGEPRAFGWVEEIEEEEAEEEIKNN